MAGNARKLDDAIDLRNDLRFEYFGLRTVYDRYLLRHPTSRLMLAMNRCIPNTLNGPATGRRPAGAATN